MELYTIQGCCRNGSGLEGRRNKLKVKIIIVRINFIKKTSVKATTMTHKKNPLNCYSIIVNCNICQNFNTFKLLILTIKRDISKILFSFKFHEKTTFSVTSLETNLICGELPALKWLLLISIHYVSLSRRVNPVICQKLVIQLNFRAKPENMKQMYDIKADCQYLQNPLLAHSLRDRNTEIL